MLALIDAAEVGRLKSEFLQAISQMRLKRDNVERLRPLAGNAIPAREFLEVQTDGRGGPDSGASGAAGARESWACRWMPTSSRI